MKNMISPYCTGYQNYTSVHTNNATWWELSTVVPGNFLNFYLFLTAVKAGLHRYLNTSFSRSEVNQMWIHVLKCSNQIYTFVLYYSMEMQYWINSLSQDFSCTCGMVEEK
jgi:hypothetical protein